MPRARASLVAAALLLPGLARATVGSCGSGDAPSSPTNYTTASCSSACVESGSELVCDLQALCGSDGVNATLVTGFGSSNHDVSAWGNCLASSTTTRFCCVFDEGATAIDTVILNGTSGDDEILSFTFDLGGGNERNLQPWDSDPIDGFVHGRNGDDDLLGSNYAGTDLDENLIGGGGADSLVGNAGGDFLKGADGDDFIDAGAGNDTIWGGDGDDAMYRGDGSDKMCDASGYDECATDGGNYFDGGAGDDKIWYSESENPSVPCPGILMNGSSTAGAGTNDQCGDYSNFTEYELPDLCEVYLTTKPTLCVGAN